LRDTTKAGKRHSDSDQQHLDAALEHMVKAGAMHAPEAAPEAMAVPGFEKSAVDAIVYGGEVKALGGGRVGGYLVRYGDENKTDLAKEFFTAQTDFGDAVTSDTHYHHGLDVKLGKRTLGKGKLKRDDVGVWIEAQLELRDEYEKAVYGLAEAGKLGWSSGTAAHLIERTQVGKATWIKRWPLGLDASLTPTPAEPRNDVIPLKSLISGETPVQAVPDGTPAMLEVKNTQGEFTMTPEELAKMQADMAAIKAQNDALKAQTDALLVELRKPALNTAPPQPVITVVDNSPPFPDLGTQLKAVANVTTRTATIEQGNRLDAVKALAVKASGANEQIGSEGGFLVQSDFSSTIYERAYVTGEITRRCSKQPIGAGFSGVKIPAVDETSRANGSRWGGLRAYWASEAATATATKPAWRIISLELKKLLAAMYATDELLEDTSALTGYAMRVVPLEIAFKIEDAIINGTGGGLPLGILNAAGSTLVSVAKESGQAAATIVYNNVLKMWARMWAGGAGPNIANGTGGSQSATVWLINQDVLPSLATMQLPVGTGGSAVFLPPGGASGSPYGTLLGRSLIPVEQCKTLGTKGDIMLVDLSQYILADKGGIKAASSIHVQFLAEETTFRWSFRADGQPLWNSALAPFNGSNTQSPFISLDTRS